MTDLFVGPESELLVGTLLQGVLGSDDGGLTWKSRNRGIRALRAGAIAIDPRMASTIWVGSAEPDGRIAVSRDGGEKWDWRDGFPAGVSVDRIAIDPSSSEHVLASAYSSSDAGFGLDSLWTTPDDGVSWSASSFPSSFSLFITGFAFDARNSARVLAGSTAGVSVSEDGGATFSGGIGDSQGGVAVDPADPRRMYTAIYRSADYGFNWEPMMPQPNSARIVAVGEAGAVYVAWSGHGMGRSDDFGLHFQAADAGIQDVLIADFAADAKSPHVLAVPSTTISPPGSPRLFASGDRGGSWTRSDAGLPDVGVAAVAIDSTSGFAYAASDGGLYRLIQPDATCRPAANTLCLGGGRFRAQVVWTTSSATGSGQTRPLTSDAGAFWFFSDNNLELVIKVVDGTAVDGHFWVFGAALTDVEYELAITDTTTGKVWTRHNPQGNLESFADTSAFQAAPALQ